MLLLIKTFLKVPQELMFFIMGVISNYKRLLLLLWIIILGRLKTLHQIDTSNHNIKLKHHILIQTTDYFQLIKRLWFKNLCRSPLYRLTDYCQMNNKDRSGRGTFIIWVLIDFLTTLLNFLLKKFMGLKQMWSVVNTLGVMIIMEAADFRT